MVSPQLDWRGLRCVGLISSTARGSPGWTGARPPCPPPTTTTTTTPGPSVPSVNPACTTRAPRPPAASPPSTRAPPTQTRCPRRRSRRRRTPARICTRSPRRPRRTCRRTRGPRLPGWTRRNLSSTKCRSRRGWRWRAPVRWGAATIPWRRIPPTPSRRHTSTAAVCFTQAACWEHHPASTTRTKARPGRAPVSPLETPACNPPKLNIINRNAKQGVFGLRGAFICSFDLLETVTLN